MAIRTAKEFAQLISYYINCLIKEDALACTFDLHSEGTTYCILPTQTSKLTNETSTIEIPMTETIERFFAHSHDNKQLYYAAPLIIDANDKRIPALIQEIEVQPTQTGYSLTSHAPHPSLNPAVLCTQHYTIEETQHIRTSLEDQDYEKTTADLASLLHLPIIPADAKKYGPRIIPTGILFYADKTGMTTSLIRELTLLAQRPLDDISHSALYLLLTDTLPARTIPSPALLEIFLMNPSQEHAVTSSLTQPVTLITGPPGTGKSQVVLNIIANAVINHKTVLFASKNNKAVDVVIDKLNIILPRRLAIRLGHRAIRQQTAHDSQNLFANLPPPPDTTTITHDYTTLSHDLTQTRTILNQISSLNHQIDAAHDRITTDLRSLPEHLHDAWQHLTSNAIDTARLVHNLARYFPQTPSHHSLHPWTKTKQHTIYHRHIDTLPPELHKLLNTDTENPISMATTLRHLALLHDIKHNQTQITSLTTHLHQLPTVPSLIDHSHTLQRQRQTHARTLLTAHWLTRLHTDPDTTQRLLTTYLTLTTEHTPTTTEDYAIYTRHRTNTFRNLLPTLPVWTVTNLSVHQSLPLEPALFDLLIIDEASQCDIPSALPLLYRAKTAVIIGDPHQLNHVSLLTHADDRHQAHTTHTDHLHDTYAYTTHSLYDLIHTLTNKTNHHPILLNEHYRCHPDIITYANTYHYHNQLTIMTINTPYLTHPTHPHHIHWHHTPGHTTPAPSPYNEPEADTLITILTNLITHYTTHNQHPTIGIVTLFRAQADLITTKITTHPTLKHHPITIGTAHKFQGDERDIILISPAVSTGIKPGTLHWITTTRQLLNVAVTRARAQCLIIADATACTTYPGPLHDLHHYTTTLTTPTTPTNPHTTTLHTTLTTTGLPYTTPPPTTPPIDLTLTINNHRYAILLTPPNPTTDTLLRHQGWIPRHHPLTPTQDPTTILPDLLRLY